jgi:hypothetical protein
MRNTLTTQADAVQMAVKQFLSVPEGNGVHDLEHFDLYTWPQVWGSTATGWGGVGGQMVTSENVTCIVRGNRCCVYFGGRFAYEANLLDPWFRKRYDAKRVPSFPDFKAHIEQLEREV